MKSPFPGMDPFIEFRGDWGDFHDKLIVEIDRAISPQLPARYISRIAKRNYIDWIDPQEEEKRRRPIVPDVAIQEFGSLHSPSTAGTVAIAESDDGSVAMRAKWEVEFQETYVDIWDVEQDRHLVTSIEVLSPTSKARGTAGWMEYERKRNFFLQGNAHLIEIDLLRGGKRHPMHEPWPESPYYLMVMRKESAPDCRVWAASSLEPLPPIPVPLLSPDADVLLSLQPLIENIFAWSRYFVQMKYDEALDALTTQESALVGATVKGGN